MQPLILSKLNTGLQILLLGTTLLDVALYPLPDWFNQTLQWIVALSTLLSGMAYVILWGRDAFKKVIHDSGK